MKRLLLTLGALFFFTGQAYCFEDISPTEAYALASTNEAVYILDVRTAAEWSWVGHPGANSLDEGLGLEGKVVNISYKKDIAGELVVNPSFLKDVNEIFEEAMGNVTLIPMCRSGKRSVAASTLLEVAGYNVYNMVTGFQGGKDERGYRTVNGWVVDGLPYKISSSGGYAD